MPKIAPSILSADFSRLGEQCEAVTNAGADFIHVDVMDGHFVPNISFGAAVMKCLNGCKTAPYDVHLMIEDPDRYLEDFATDKTRFITVHQEACVHLDRTLEHIRSLGVGAGVAVNPATPVSTLSEVLYKTDLVLVMTVNPGFGGQKLIPRALEKLTVLDELRRENGYSFLTEVDGGINRTTASDAAAAGADILVAGSAVFKSGDLREAVSFLKTI